MAAFAFRADPDYWGAIEIVGVGTCRPGGEGVALTRAANRMHELAGLSGDDLVQAAVRFAASVQGLQVVDGAGRVVEAAQEPTPVPAEAAPEADPSEAEALEASEPSASRKRKEV